MSMTEKVVIGNATLYHGDCLEILPTLQGVDAVVTDPPYGIAWRRGENKARDSKAHDGIQNDQDTSCRDNALAALGTIPAVVFGSFYAPFPSGLKQVCVWHKPSDSGLVGSVTGFRRDAEPVFLCGQWPVRTVKRSSVVRSLRNFQGATAAEAGHPHAKPVDLIESLVMELPGTVIDPFMGSGTTGVACANLRRPFIGIEIERKYFDIACERIENAQRQARMFA
jgi:DNA modification methylase